MRRALRAPARRLLDGAVREAERRGVELWAVAGVLRDVAVGRAAVDVDLAVERDAAGLARAVAEATGGEATIEERFGTASVVAGGERLDVATLRRERYARPGALPEVSFGASIEEDLGRRDFNVNAMALGLVEPRRGELVDPFGGLADLGRGRYAVLHERSFEEDATRLWRGARLGAQLDLQPSEETRELMASGARWVETISGDRLWAEWALIAERERAGRTLGSLDACGVLAATSAGLALSEAARDALRHRWRPLPAARLAAVVLGGRDAASGDHALERLNAPVEARRAVADARALLAAGATGSSGEPSVLGGLESTGEEGRMAALWLDPRQVGLQRELRRWERARSPLGARELLRLGVPEGPRVGELLRCLRRERYLGRLETSAEARALVRRELGRR